MGIEVGLDVGIDVGLDVGIDVGLDVGMRDDTREPIPHSRRLETEAVGLRRREKD